jgi:hypothetical protein
MYEKFLSRLVRVSNVETAEFVRLVHAACYLCERRSRERTRRVLLQPLTEVVKC